MFNALLEDTFVVTCVSNTARYRRRYELYQRFSRMMKASGIDFITVEIAFGDRPFEVTNSVQTNHLQLRTIEEFWHKENGLNLGVSHGQRLWPNKKRVLWIDADCEPVGRTANEWFAETWHELQHFEFVQMWEWLQPLDHNGNPLGGPNPSFMSNYIKYGTPYPKQNNGYPIQWGSPGLAWGANLSAFNQVGSLPDAGILGAGDWYFAHALISDLPFQDMEKSKYSPDYVNYWRQRQELCQRWIKRDVGYVKGLAMHYFHGKTKDRGYNTRENILIEEQFSPLTDLKRDHQGLYQLETWDPRQMRIRDRARQYFRYRNEDSIDS